MHISQRMGYVLGETETEADSKSNQHVRQGTGTGEKQSKSEQRAGVKRRRNNLVRWKIPRARPRQTPTCARRTLTPRDTRVPHRSLA
jgi:hypothetical protein